MPKVICVRENASDNISGVAFFAHERGKISEDIDQATADRFVSIGGYELALEVVPEVVKTTRKAKAVKVEAVETAAEVVAEVVDDPLEF